MTFEPYPDLNLKTSTFSLQDFTTHYLWVASFPGGELCARKHVNHMAKTCPELFAELPAMLTDAMRLKARSETLEQLGQSTAPGKL